MTALAQRTNATLPRLSHVVAPPRGPRARGALPLPRGPARHQRPAHPGRLGRGRRRRRRGTSTRCVGTSSTRSRASQLEQLTAHRRRPAQPARPRGPDERPLRTRCAGRVDRDRRADTGPAGGVLTVRVTGYAEGYTACSCPDPALTFAVAPVSPTGGAREPSVVVRDHPVASGAQHPHGSPVRRQPPGVPRPAAARGRRRPGGERAGHRRTRTRRRRRSRSA